VEVIEINLSDEEIMNLYNDCLPYIKSVIHKYHIPKYVENDYMSIGKIAMMNSIEKFDKKFNNDCESIYEKYKKWAKVCIKNTILSELRKHKNIQNRFEDSCESIDTIKTYREVENECFYNDEYDLNGELDE
jgi:DNA-directed RNA polymerase specialized sigma subunit